MRCFALELDHKISQGLLEWCWFHNRLNGAMPYRLLIQPGGWAGSSFKQSVTRRMNIVSGTGVLVPLEETPNAKCFLIPMWSPLSWKLCKVVVHSCDISVWCWGREALSLDTKGILERKYKAESSTKLRCRWWSVLETNGQWTGSFLLFIIASPSFSTSVQRMEPRAPDMRQVLYHWVTPFSKEKYTFGVRCSNPLQWEKVLLSQSFSLSVCLWISHATVWAPLRTLGRWNDLVLSLSEYVW